MKSFWIPLAMVWMSAGGAQAASPHPCRADVERFCKDEARSPAAVVDCMRLHREEISPECRARQQERRQACASDVERFCAPMKGQPAKVMGCLQEHLQELSDDCRSFGKRGP